MAVLVRPPATPILADWAQRLRTSHPHLEVRLPVDEAQARRDLLQADAA